MADGAEAAAFKRMTRGYAVDLGVAVILVLVLARLLLPSPPESAPPIILAQIAGAVGRFTPDGLWELYLDTVGASLFGFSHDSASGPFTSVWVGLQVIGTILLAAPDTLIAAYRFGSGAETWVTVSAGVSTAVCFVLLLLFGETPSYRRVLLAVLISPAIVSALFWLVQQILLDAFDVLAWGELALPWCLVCPVLCTLWWAVFPDARTGATMSVLSSFGGWRVPGTAPGSLPPAATGPTG